MLSPVNLKIVYIFDTSPYESMTSYVRDPHVTQEGLLQQRKRGLLHIEEKLCKYNLHHELLLNYKKNHKFPKGMSLKFNLSLCNDEETKILCRQVLRKASLGLRYILLDKVPKKVESLKSEKADVIRTLKNNITLIIIILKN